VKLFDKCKTIQFGILLITVGAFIPLILYPFTSKTFEDRIAAGLFAKNGISYETRLQDLEIVLVKGEYKVNDKNVLGVYEGRLAFPYKFPMAFGILLSFIGIILVAFKKIKGNQISVHP
jgi:hypothetical protein